MAAAALAFSLMSVLVKEASHTLPSAQTLVQNAGPMFVQLKQAADRAYMAAAERHS